MSNDKYTPSNRLVTVLDNGSLTQNDYASVSSAIDTLRTQDARITELEEQLVAVQKDADLNCHNPQAAAWLQRCT